jgi:uncharacterized protein (DUF1499 family)
MIKSLLFVLLAICVFLGCSSKMAKKPRNLGVIDGQLVRCPDSPNCVSSQAEGDKQHVSPVPLTGTSAETMGRIVSALKDAPRVTIITRTDNYLHAECRSALFRFVDDLEVFIDEDEGAVHFRSASRTGYSDFGVNRKRVENLKKTAF